MKNTLFLGFALLLTACGAFAQEHKDTTGIFSLKNFQLQNTFDESGKKPSPAQFQFTLPDGKAKSWLIDAGLAYKFAQSATFTSKVLVEFHKNTLIDKTQENLSAGYSGQWLQKADHWQQLITAGAKYVHDWKDSTHSLAVTGNYTLFKADQGFRVNAPGYLADDAFTYLLTPYIGFEYQQIIQSKASTQTGTIFRGLYNVSGAFAVNKHNPDPVNNAPHKLIEASLDYTGRDAFTNQTGNGENGTHLFKAGLSFYIVDQESTQVSLGVTYNDGSNPLQGLKPQKFWQLTVNIQL
ncbi:MAG: hypothetical protein JWP44_3773 [Mucilaginibacter sp.]|nr:hypothetical protein [Mucilaginibacter sp.]